MASGGTLRRSRPKRDGLMHKEGDDIVVPFLLHMA